MSKIIEILDGMRDEKNADPNQWKNRLLRTKDGKITSCLSNIMAITRNDEKFTGKIRYNEVTSDIEYGNKETDVYERATPCSTWDDGDSLIMLEWLANKYHLSINDPKRCDMAIERVAKENAFDPIQDWLKSLPHWDETERLPSFFVDACCTPYTPAYEFFGVSLFISMIARAIRPGCQCDTMTVLCGLEGIKKTQFCRLIGGPWYRCITTSFQSKDLQIALNGAWLGELAELDAISKAERSRTAALLTCTHDSYRPPYGRRNVNIPRRTVFIGTTNEDTWITDPYGARRYHPVTVVKVNIDYVAETLLQLFAEALYRYNRGEQWWSDDGEVIDSANDERDGYFAADPWEEIIRDFTDATMKKITVAVILGPACLNMPAEKQTRAASTRVGTVMKRLGWRKYREMYGGARSYCYIKDKP